MNYDNLLDENLESFNYINKSHKPDGEGGTVNEWTEGLEFKAHARLDNSIQAKIAGKQGVTSLYTIITHKNVSLENNDVIRRKPDGKIFRITSDGYDDKTPNGAGLEIKKVSAEYWVLPDD